MKAKALSLSILLVLLANTAHADPTDPDGTPTARSDDGPKLGVFVDTFYAWDFHRPADNRRPGFLYNHARHNELSISLALVTVAFEREAARLKLGLMAGTYAEDNLAFEQPLLRNLFEAQVGVRLDDALWLDAGLFPSHIGYEGAISLHNPTLTRSLAAENTPYYLAGVKLSFAVCPTVVFNVIVANGWQNLQETTDNDMKGLGTQLTWTHRGLTFNWSAWVSDEAPRTSSAWRVFNNVYLAFTDDDLTLVLNADLGIQDNAELATWYAFYLIARLRVAEPLSLSARVERFADPDGVIVAPDGQGVALTGGSLGLDVHLAEGALYRVEARALLADRAIFDSGESDLDLALTTSLALQL
jgi:hypothetical protein